MTLRLSDVTSRTTGGRPSACAAREYSRPVRDRPAPPARCVARQWGIPSAPMARRFRFVGHSGNGRPGQSVVLGTTAARLLDPTSDARPSGQLIRDRHPTLRRRDRPTALRDLRGVPVTAGHLSAHETFLTSVYGMQEDEALSVFAITFPDLPGRCACVGRPAMRNRHAPPVEEFRADLAWEDHGSAPDRDHPVTTVPSSFTAQGFRAHRLTASYVHAGRSTP